jgi:hypothetical protein
MKKFVFKNRVNGLTEQIMLFLCKFFVLIISIISLNGCISWIEHQTLTPKNELAHTNVKSNDHHITSIEEVALQNSRNEEKFNKKSFTKDNNRPFFNKVPGTPVRNKYEKVEVLWQVPQSAVDQYLIEFQVGGQKSIVQKEVETISLEKIDHPNFGYVYRYVINQIPKGQRVKVRLTGKTNGILSAPSEIFELKSQN